MASNYIVPYCGEWTLATAAHLLRRAAIGPTYEEIVKAHSDGLSATLDRLFQRQDAPPPPLLHRPETEPEVMVGETWIDRVHPAGGGAHRGQSFKGWFFKWLMESPLSVQPQLVMFWLNHFGLEEISDHRAGYRYVEELQTNYQGNARDMVKRISIEPAMLKFLDGERNNQERPNENFARELFELFTIQKGPQVADGDHTNYTEEDVVTMARCMTGWRNRPFTSTFDDTPVESYFDLSWHDTDTKQLSHRFGNMTINAAPESEYEVVIDQIFLQRQTAISLCEKLYRFFVHYDLNDSVRKSIIEPLANVMIQHDFEIAPVLRTLLQSDHFYSTDVWGAKIKNPIELIVSILRPVGEFSHVTFPSLQLRYEASSKQHTYCQNLDMKFNDAPTVAGWRAYYLEPAFYRNWVAPAPVQYREFTILSIVSPTYHINQFPTRINWRDYLRQLSGPGDVNRFIEDSMLVFLTVPLHPSQVALLKEHLVPTGLDDSVWAVEYLAYANNPNDEALAHSFERRVYDFFRHMFTMMDFQLH